MNKLSLAICGMLVVVATLCSAEFTTVKSKAAKRPNQVKFIEEGFEGDLVPPAGWMIVDADSDGYNWRYVAGFAAHSGSRSISSDSYINNQGALTPDNYLIMPPIPYQHNTQGQLSYWVSTQDVNFSSEHYAVMMSTTGTAPEDFTTTLFEETITAKDVKVPGSWYERFVTFPFTEINQPVYLAFRHYNSIDNFAINLDDVEISVWCIDQEPPSVGAPNGVLTHIDSNMNISTFVTDETGIASVIGHYKLNGQTTWTDFTMTSTKVSNTYHGTIPAQYAPINGKVKFTATDTSAPSNTGESPEYNIAWQFIADNHWLEWGENYDTGSGVGVASAPWRAGIDFDFGTTTHWRPSALRLAVSTPISVPWVIRKAIQINFNTILLGDLVENFQGTIYCDGVDDIAPAISTIEDSTKNLTGHVVLVFDMPSQSYITRDLEAISQHTYVNTVLNDTLKTLTSLAPQFPGAWFMGIKIKKMCGIEEETDMLPGSSQLNQNYPNPFNPSTTISFYNNMSGNVQLTVLNARGETVATLINSKTSAGNHKVTFDGSKFNSGVYFYKLETPTAVITKKMMLIK